MLYLIGFMGVGKTTIGKQFASHHNLRFIDTDKEIEKNNNKSISDIFEKEGENYFRESETEILGTLKKEDIIACGGGLPNYNNNMDFIKKTGVSIYLEASEKEIFNRLSNKLKKRPLIREKSNKELKGFIKKELKRRQEFYLMADYIIKTDKLSEEDVLRKINSLIISI